jgi:uncharacterized protein YkuJ
MKCVERKDFEIMGEKLFKIAYYQENTKYDLYSILN